MNKEERQEGYYWTGSKVNDLRLIAEFSCNKWWVVGKKTPVDEQQLCYISPEPIKPQIMNKETQTPLTQEQVEAIEGISYKMYPPITTTERDEPFAGTYDANFYKRKTFIEELTKKLPELLDKLGLQVKPTKTQDSLQQEKKCKLKNYQQIVDNIPQSVKDRVKKHFDKLDAEHAPKSDWIKIEEGCEMPEDGKEIWVCDAGDKHPTQIPSVLYLKDWQYWMPKQQDPQPPIN